MEHLGQYDSGVSYKKIVFWFVVAVIAVALATWYFVLSRVTITLIPKSGNKELNMDVVVDANMGSIDMEHAVIPGHFLTEEGRQAQSFANVPPKRLEENATGTIVIYNNYTRAQGFKEGDVLIAEGANGGQKIFLKESTIVYRSQKRTVKAVASTKGIAGNIPAGKFVFEKHDDFMRGQVWAESVASFEGGIRTANLITEDDIVVARKELTDKISDNNLEKIRGKLKEGEELGRDNLINAVTFFHSDVAAPFEATGFNLDMTVKTTAVVFKKENLISLIDERLKNMTGDDEEFLAYDQQSLSYTVDRVATEDQKAYLKVHVRGKFHPKLSTKIFDKDEVKGYNERALRAHYKNFSDIENIDVNFWPSFRKTVPDMDSQIIIEIKKD